MKDIYLEIDFDVTLRAAGKTRCADDADIEIVKLNLIALCNKYRLASSFEKELGEIDNAHIMCFCVN